MYTDKIQDLENEIIMINSVIKADKKEIKKREKILNMTVDEDLETEILEYNEEIVNLKRLLQTKKKLLKNYKKL